MQIGINGRFFPNNWRSAMEEVDYCARHGFQALQFSGREEGLSSEHLGASLHDISRRIQESGINPVMEIVVRVDSNGLTAQGLTPTQVLQANMTAIMTLRCTAVHWHLVTNDSTDSKVARDLEIKLRAQLREAVDMAQETGFRFGIEHNAPDQKLFNTPEVCTETLKAIPDLWLVWDFNHTAVHQAEGYKKLIPRVSLLHVSDTPLPDTNHHLPLGMGNIDFADYCCTLLKNNFADAAILEIGGLPKSGGYNRDTDEALSNSQQYLRSIIDLCSS